MTQTNPEISNDQKKELLATLMETVEWKAISDIGLDPVDVTSKYIDAAFKMHKDNEKSRVNFIISRFNNEIKIAAAVDNRGIVLGTVDENYEDGASKRRPETFAVLTNDGSIKKVVTFKHDMVTKPGLYTFDLAYDAEKESYTARSVLEFRELTKNPIEFFGNPAVAISPSSSAWDDGTIVTSKYPVVIVRGIISYVRPVPRFAKNEDGKSSIVGDFPIYQANLREPVPDMQPTFRLSFNSEGTSNFVTVTFRQCMYSNPYFGVSGIADAFAYAIASETDPEKQIELIEHMFVGKEMAVVGYVSRINQSIDREGNEATQIAIRGIACLDLDPECSGFDESVAARKNVPKPTKIENPVAKPAAKATEVVGTPNVSTPEAGMLNVDAVIIEDAPASEDEESGESDYPDYTTDPDGFVDMVIRNITTIIKMVHVEQSKVTISYIKKTLMLEKANVPDTVWKTIVSIVKSSM